MDDPGFRGSHRGQSILTAFMLGLGIGLLALLSANARAPRAGVTVETIFALGGLVTALGLVASVFSQPWLLRATSVALAAIGVTALLLLTAFPNPRLDPLLFASGAWTTGPIPLSAGWAHLAMAAFLIMSGAILPFARSRSQRVELTVLIILRSCLWLSAFWQLSYVILNGDFSRLFDRPAPVVIQIGVVVTLVAGWVFLLRGDRRWLGTLTRRDDSVAFARFVLPVTILPVLGSYVIRSWAHLGGYCEELAPILNGVISSAVMYLLSLAALRSIWIERRTRGALAQALQRSPVIVQSMDGVIEYWPHECELMFGLSASQAVGKNKRDLLKTEYQEPESEVDEALRTRGEWSGEIKQSTRDGRSLWMASRIVVVHSNEEATKIVETLTDISDLKETVIALADTTDSLKQAVATYELGVVEFELKTGRTKFSTEFERIIGIEPGTLDNDPQSWISILAPAEAELARDLMVKDIGNRRAERPVSLKIKRMDGEMRDLSGRLRYRYRANGELERLVGIFRDVTDQLRDRQEVELRGTRLLDMQTELAHTSRLSAMGEMAAALAHELNQPLTAVANSVGAIDMLLKDKTKPVDDKKRQQVLRAAKHAEAQAVRAGEIIRRLREFISRGESDTNVENLSGLIDDAIALALPNPKAEGIDIDRTLVGKAIRVLANRIQIQQVLVNLVRNAVESMRGQFGPKRLDVVVTVDHGMATISIADTGSGVSPEMVDRLFSPFLSTKADGMGVGLSICRRIIEAHGGELWLGDSAGVGATFKFTLPLFAKG